MNREELITSKEFVFTKMQLDLLNLIEGYMQKNGLNRTQLAEKLGVGKSYVSQLLNVSFDHKISKIVDIALDCNAIPLLFFIDLKEYVRRDAEDKIYGAIPMMRPRKITFSVAQRQSDDSQINEKFILGQQMQVSHGE